MKTNLIPKNAKRVGLLGGSFNPAHEGHRHISLQAIKSFNLDYVVWLVSPQNPLKSLNVRNTLESRVKYAITLSDHADIIVSDIEKNFANSYTITTVKEITKKFPKVDFIWIMGADNMVQFPKWQNWQEILDIMPICVYDRTGYTKEALHSKVAKEYKGKIVKRSYKGDLKAYKWYFMMMKKINISSSAIRRGAVGGENKLGKI